MPLSRVTHWIFDMDGTLTVAVHDFDAIRRDLDLPPGVPILEAIARQPAQHAAELTRRLDELELEFARQARPQPGARALLADLAGNGRDLGIVTRNSETLALETLRRAGLLEFFREEHIIGRESVPPKPEPDGILSLIEGWGGDPADAVMVGDYRFDLDAGRRAGTRTVYYDVDDTMTWATQADLRVRSHDELRGLARSHPEA